MDHVIRLRSAVPPQALAAGDVYFAFPSGRLSYDCVSCNATCCRGHGYELGSDPEIRQQLAMRRSLPLFLDRRSSISEGFAVSNCAPGCFFLLPDGRCEIHATAGHDAKPETCRLFPFNNLRRLGKTLIVAPHPSLCPLRVTPAGVSDALSDHRALFDGMSRSGISAVIAEGGAGTADTPAAIRLERRVAALADDCLDRGDHRTFLAWQMALATQGATLQASSIAIDHASAMQRELLGLATDVASVDDADLARTLIAITPALRSFVLFPRSTEVTPGAPSISADRLPLVMLGLWGVAGAARDAGLQEATIQSLLQMFRTFQPLLEVLAYADSPVCLARDAAVDAGEFKDIEGRIAFVKLLRALMPRHQLRRRAPLGALLLETAPRHPLARILFLKQMARLLGRNLAPLDAVEASGRARSPRQRMRAAAQHLVLSYLPEQSLEWAYRRGVQSGT